jgi:hypothetical protein
VDSTVEETETKASGRPWIKRTIIAILSVAIGYLVLQFAQGVQWSAVGDSFRQLEPWHIAFLLALLMVRQLFNATPLTRFVPGVTLGKAVQNDLSANVVATFAPPPADVVLRVSMFRSWGVHPVDGMAGVTLGSIVFYAARFTAPVIGLVLLAFVGLDTRQWLVGGVSALLAATILTTLIVVLRSETWAELVGRTAARLVRKLRAQVDGDVWAAAVSEFRGRIVKVVKSNLVPAMAGMLAAIVTDSAILLLSLRFVGISAEQLPTVEILAAFYMVYPLTILPLFGLGVMDALMLASWSEIAGPTYESTLLAGTIVWRTVTIGGTLILGAFAASWWRLRNQSSSMTSVSTDTAPADDSQDEAEPS